MRKYAEAANVLANGIYKLSGVNFEGVSLYDFTKGKFDSVYIPEVVYHLSVPVLALRRLFNRLRDGGDEKGLGRGGWAWFWPTASLLGEWMYEAGFEDIQVFYSPASNRVYGWT